MLISNSFTIRVERNLLIKTEFSTLLFMALMAVVFLSHQSPSNFTSSKILLAQFIFP